MIQCYKIKNVGTGATSAAKSNCAKFACCSVPCSFGSYSSRIPSSHIIYYQTLCPDFCNCISLPVFSHSHSCPSSSANYFFFQFVWRQKHGVSRTRTTSSCLVSWFRIPSDFTIPQFTIDYQHVYLFLLPILPKAHFQTFFLSFRWPADSIYVQVHAFAELKTLL